MVQGAGRSLGPPISMPDFVVYSDIFAPKVYSGNEPFVDESIVYLGAQRN